MGDCYFEKMLYWEEFKEITSLDGLAYIGKKSREPRADNVAIVDDLSSICNCQSFLLEYDYDKDSFSCEGDSYNIKNDIQRFLDRLDRKQPIMLNITSLNLRLMGSFLYNIKKMKFEKVFCVYTEPQRYCKNPNTTDEAAIDKFDLYKRFRGIEAIPGFVRENDTHLTERWIVLLGFEGKRSEQIKENYEFKNIATVITLPSYQPGWHNFVFDENLDLIKKVGNKPEYVIANSYLSTYTYLQNVLSANPQTYIRVSPLGTKINALGALLFSLNYTKRVEILYDNPVEEGQISIDAGKRYVFDISEVISKKEE